MARSPVSKRIVPTDDGYQDIWDAWDMNGRPSQFDRMGSWGGAIYRVLRPDLDEPDFYQAVSDVETLWSDSSASEKPIQEGWWTINRRYMYLQARWTFDGRIKITKPELPNKI